MWTPRVEILDRTLMDIGDRVVFGYLCGFSCHGVSPINGKNALIVKKIKIGDKAFIGVEARVGPGVTIESKQLVKPQSALYWKGEYKRP